MAGRISHPAGPRQRLNRPAMRFGTIGGRRGFAVPLPDSFIPSSDDSDYTLYFRFVYPNLTRIVRSRTGLIKNSNPGHRNFRLGRYNPLVQNGLIVHFADKSMMRHLARFYALLLCSAPALLAQGVPDVQTRLTAVEAAAKSAQSAGDNAWMLVSSALVLMMTGPGLALFYGGLVRRKNVLGTMMQSFSLMAVVTVLWAIVGYSLAFGEGTAFFGDLRYLFLNGVSNVPNADYAGTIPQQTFMIYQLMFAIITPALISGAFAERMKFSAMLLFMTLWSLFVYAPMAH